MRSIYVILRNKIMIKQMSSRGLDKSVVILDTL